MTTETILQTHKLVFYQALLDQNWTSLAELYADDYSLVRSNGTVLSKKEVLTDLQSGDLLFTSIKPDECACSIDRLGSTPHRGQPNGCRTWRYGVCLSLPFGCGLL